MFSPLTGGGTTLNQSVSPSLVKNKAQTGMQGSWFWPWSCVGNSIPQLPHLQYEDAWPRMSGTSFHITMGCIFGKNLWASRTYTTCLRSHVVRGKAWVGVQMVCPGSPPPAPLPRVPQLHPLSCPLPLNSGRVCRHLHGPSTGLAVLLALACEPVWTHGLPDSTSPKFVRFQQIVVPGFFPEDLKH